MSRLTPFGFLFGKSLNDLVRGIRRYPDPDQKTEYLRDVISECRDEVRSPDLDIKSTAVLKLAYLEMLGYDMAWAGFHVTEVMASPHFQQKRVGYLAAMQSFRSDPELLMLVTNLLKMDLVSQNIATVGIALSGLATIVTPLLAADVADDIMRMLSHSKPYIRQKAVLALHNVVLQYPEALPVALHRIADLLDQSQSDYTDAGSVSVIGATVSVICELATHSDNIGDFLELTPKLYAIFTTSQHNWTLIKLLKIFQLFTRHEPRLKSRLLPAITDVMASTEAVSLIYESMNCILLGGMLDDTDYGLGHDIVKHTTSMMERNDANLTLIATKMLGLVADVNPQFLNKSVVFELLRSQQPDPVTRKHVLHLAAKVADDDTFFDVVSELMNQFHAATTPDYQLDVAQSISQMAASHNYEFVPDFQWLIGDVFTEICEEVVSEELSTRLLDIAVRVKDDSVRELVSELCSTILQRHTPGEAEADLINDSNKADSDVAISETSFFETCWWIIGEFPTTATLRSPLEFIARVRSITHSRASPAVVTCVAKVVSKLEDPDDVVLDAAIDLLTPYSFSLDFELQERTCQFLELLKLARSSPDQASALLNNGLASLFTSYELTPIAPGSQRRIKPPADLDLSTPIEVAAVPSLESQLDSDSSSESEWETPVAASMGTGSSVTTESSRSVTPEAEANKQLYNLTLLDSMRNDPAKPFKLPKPAKKKVVIAADETVADDAEETKPVSSHKRNSSLFKSGFRGHTNQLVEPEAPVSSPEPAPVKVKHKKKKTKKPESKKADKPELKSPETPSEA